MYIRNVDSYIFCHYSLSFPPLSFTHLREKEIFHYVFIRVEILLTVAHNVKL